MNGKAYALYTDRDGDTAPANRLSSYTMSDGGNFYPYAQARAKVSLDGILLELLSFETAPDEHSKFLVCINPSSDRSNRCFNAVINYKESGSFAINGQELDVKLPVTIFKGEDLQGEYWGATVMFSAGLIGLYFAEYNLRAGGSFYMNVKLTRALDGAVHSASLFDDEIGEVLIV